MIPTAWLARMRAAMARWQGRPSSDLCIVCLIALLWITAIVLVNPLGDFPSIDDWAYAASVRSLVERGEITFSDWTATNLVSQIFWGAVFAFPFGTTYTVLRVSTLVLAFVGATALFLILRSIGCDLVVSALGALLLLFNPMYCMLSFTFMTDVPYTAMQTIAMLFLFAGIREGARLATTLGWGVALTALLCRQVAVAIPLGFAGARAVLSRDLRWKNILAAIAPIGVFIATQATYQLWLKSSGHQPMNFGRNVDFLIANLTVSPRSLASTLFHAAIDISYYFGYFMTPLSLIVVAHLFRKLPHWAGAASWTGIFVLAGLATWRGPRMPIWGGDVIGNASLGVEISGTTPVAGFWLAMTAFSALGAIILAITAAAVCWTMWHGVRDGLRSIVPQLCATIMGMVLLAPVVMLPGQWRFDRYTIPAIPCLVIVIGSQLRAEVIGRIPRTTLLAAAICVLTLAPYAILGTHDYFAEKRVRWMALQDLVLRDHVPAETIDAGWVFNAPTSFGVYGDPNNLGTWFKTREYAIVSERDANELGYIQERRYKVFRWAPWNSASSAIVVIHRTAGSLRRIGVGVDIF